MTDIVTDSTLIPDPEDHQLVNQKTSFIYIGMIKEVDVDDTSNEPIYLVEVIDGLIRWNMTCQQMVKFGGVYNYEETIGRGFTKDEQKEYICKIGRAHV